MVITLDLLADLKAVLSERQIKRNEKTDDLFGNTAEVIVYPESEEEIAAVLKYADENERKVVVTGKGTKRGYGGLKKTADLLLSLEEYSGIIEHTVGDMTMTVKAGTTFKQLQEYLATHQQMIPLDPSFPDDATIGGIIAANDSGPKRMGYGSARDLIIGLRVVYPNGEVIRTGGKVVKNVAGYDMNKLFVGSMGTLGVLSEVTLKLRPIPKYESVVLLSFSNTDVDEARTFTIQLLDSFMEPQSLELLSPSFAEVLTGQKKYTLAISFEDVEKSVKYQEEFINKLITKNIEMTILAKQDAKNFWHKLSCLAPNALRQSGASTLEVGLKIGVKNMDVPRIVKECQLLEEGSQLRVQARGGLGHGLCEVIIKGDEEETIIQVLQQLTESIEKIGGYVVVKHAPLSIRQKIKVWGKEPVHLFLLQGIKAKIDPNKMLNSERFIGGI